ncbi:MAG: hypothetical protein COV91_04100 [Candidatus Taylorbacteria bacterium CG11_big_fil_rev_8_21_14_0_20_46_11]|uniref:VTT domain-containing protein n=1 Tax=Candidatus Taylorbacteria bacterium CG11_big_fil_rev_8_21_14_0_20_46_11 TaxID=1975025 RepID=A0A2H0KAY8_9BACT|nr:MAG: hypothetical protein COV91_04100 [Candidatus Taylorbacteria bacterium CG11_big_fil_rev_8_21_14_0_20_46_11]
MIDLDPMLTVHAWFTVVLEWFPYPFLVPFFGAFFGGEETILLISALAGGGTISFPVLLGMAFLGTIASDSLWFLFGKTFSSWLSTKPSLHTRLDTVSQFVSRLTREKDFFALLITKFLYGTRIIMIFYFARNRMSFLRFTIYNALVTAIWASVVCVVGWMAGRGVIWISDAFGNVSLGFIIIIVIMGAIYGIRIWLNKRIIEGKKM